MTIDKLDATREFERWLERKQERESRLSYKPRAPKRAGETSRRLHCSEIWGGFGNVDDDIAIGPMTVSLFSAAHEGEKGGDIYYFSLCENDAIARIALADVVGHGDAVSHISRWMYGALASMMNNIDGTGVLVELNELANQVGLQAMTTAALLSLQVNDSSLHVSYAGHPPAWLKRYGENEWQPLVVGRGPALANVPLGVFTEATYVQERFRLHARDRLFVHTDGLTEAASSSGQLFGEERLRSVLTEGADESLAELKNRVLKAVRAHAGSLGQDEVTLMVAEVN